MFQIAFLLLVISVVGFAHAGYVGAPLTPIYGSHYAYAPVPVVKSLSSVAVAHAPLATSYSNTYKFSHPVVKPIVKHYYSPLYSYGHGYGHGFDYDYPLYLPNYYH